MIALDPTGSPSAPVHQDLRCETTRVHLESLISSALAYMAKGTKCDMVLEVTDNILYTKDAVVNMFKCRM